MVTQRNCKHREEHSRRSFLSTLGKIGAGTLVLGNLPVQNLSASPLLAALATVPEDRLLVMLRLKGGNDGLNTFIPLHDFGNYRKVRPQIHIPENEAVTFAGGLAVHPQLAPLGGLWDRGAMRVVHNVGYPDQSLSHFRSADIWATTSDSNRLENSGILGRYLQDLYPQFLNSPPADPPAIQIGGASNLLFNNDDNFNYAVSTSDPAQLYEIAKTGRLYDVNNVPECTYGDQLAYLRAVANTTFTYAKVLAEAYAVGKNEVEYQDDTLGNQLALVSRLLKGGLTTRLFVVELDGFDTHANQVEDHASLLESVSKNVAAFYDDLQKGKLDKRVLTMTFSEFGRRPEQNGSEGTDHGAAAPLMIFGPALEGSGILGDLPDLKQLDEVGNLVHKVDFRSVYATVLSRWLCIDDEMVDDLIGAPFPRVNDLDLNCQNNPNATHRHDRSAIGLKAYRDGGDFVVTYDLNQPAKVSIHCYDAAGRRLATIYTGTENAGVRWHRFAIGGAGTPAGLYLISVAVGGRAYTTKLVLAGR